MTARKVAGFALLSVLLLFTVAAVAVKLRGFRATSQPTAFETSIALGIRNFGIPIRESRKKNPYQGDELALQQGRQLFLTRCASCHGTDGRAATPIGANVYPRVPNLRLAPTQGLSDGDIHYIIQYGVQLSGMPAMPGLGSESDRDSWALVTYIRNINTYSESETRLEQKVAESAHYVGSQSCQSCHATIFQRWKKTPMANVVRDPREHPDAIIPDLKTNDIFKFTRDQVAFVYGSIWKQRYFTKVGDDFYPLPVQWDIGNKKWLKYQIPVTGADWWTAYYPADNMHRPTGATCDGCHSVSYDIHTKAVTEWNVGCERCHGPGSEHVAHPTRLNILNPSQMDSIASNDTCIACHSQGRPRNGLIDGKAYDWPVGYHVGEHLQDYWKLEEIKLGQTDFFHYADDTAHKNRMQGNDFVQSVMYEKGVTCASCHDVHGTENQAQLRKPADKICLDCHGTNSPNGPRVASLEEHTHHKDGSAGSQCVACHMPKIESEGVPGAFVSAHTFRFITPGESERSGIPNACVNCHTGKTNAWATAELKKWPTTSPWRVAD